MPGDCVPEELFCRAEAIVAAKWNISILRALGQRPARFNSLRESLPGISTNILADRLKVLEANGIVCRVKPGSCAKSRTYRLTSIGEAAEPLISALENWALCFDENA